MKFEYPKIEGFHQPIIAQIVSVHPVSTQFLVSSPDLFADSDNRKATAATPPKR